jgi:signal transduction protein with GAF and PtsI domain
MTAVADSYRHGDMLARVSYKLKNELGMLGEALNNMAGTIQLNSEYREYAAEFANSMLKARDAGEFFRTVLKSLSVYTNSQIAAAYLFHEDTNTFEHFESIGLDVNAVRSFQADQYEGELGAALLTGAVQHVKNIPEDTKYAYKTVLGSIVPREMVTVPVKSEDQVIAVITLASLTSYSTQGLHFIERSTGTINARAAGVIANMKIKAFSELLENQNRELTAQKSELISQSAELTQQNRELETQKSQLREASQMKTVFL